MSVLSIGIMIERWWILRQAARQSRFCAQDVARLLKLGRLTDALAAASGATVRHSHLARVIAAALAEWQYQLEHDASDTEAAGLAAKEAARHAAALSLAELRRGLSALATIGSTAPFVGLFGTTFGIIDAFRAMALTGSGSMGAISAGISEALVTTAFGLFVAVPAVWAYNFFLGRIEGMGVEMDRSAYQLVDHLVKRAA
jgi:biopolymer transport protein ExbB/biopolymer transport protein TolQ